MVIDVSDVQSEKALAGIEVILFEIVMDNGFVKSFKNAVLIFESMESRVISKLLGTLDWMFELTLLNNFVILKSTDGIAICLRDVHPNKTLFP